MTGTPRYLRNPAVAATAIDAETFLVRPADGEVFYLDEVSSALWRLLAEPHSRAEIVEVFTAAFPDVGSARIEADLDAALADLTGRSLVSELPAA